MLALLHHGKSPTSGALVLNVFRHLLTYQVSYVFPPSVLVPLDQSEFLVEHVTGQFRLLTLVVPCWT